MKIHNLLGHTQDFLEISYEDDISNEFPIKFTMSIIFSPYFFLLVGAKNLNYFQYGGGGVDGRQEHFFAQSQKLNQNQKSLSSFVVLSWKQALKSFSSAVSYASSIW